MKKFLVILTSLVYLFYLGLVGCNEDTKTLNIYKPLEKETLLKLQNDLEVLKDDSLSIDDSLIMYSNIILAKYPKNLADVNEKIAHVFYAKSNLYLTKVFFKKSAEEFLKDSVHIRYAEQLTNIGVLNELMGDYPKAIDNYYKALTIFNSNNAELKSSFVYNNLGIVYQQLKKRNKSIELYKKSLLITEKINRSDLSASGYNNLASVYEEFDSELDSALFYYKKAFDLTIKDSTNINILTIEANIANVYIKNGELAKADSTLTRALKHAKKHNILLGVNTLNKFKAELLIQKEDYVKAEALAKKTIEQAKESSYKKEELEALVILRICLEHQGKFEEALSVLKNYNELNQTVIGFERQKEIENLNVRFNIQQKDNKIKLLEVQKQLRSKQTKVFGFITIFIIVSLLILIYTINLKRKHSTLLVMHMQRDISEYINKIHNFEEKIYKKEENQHELFLQKVNEFNLTEREEEVLLYISKGFKNTEIADKMFVSINTVKTHIKNIFIKLDVRNRIEAANKTKA